MWSSCVWKRDYGFKGLKMLYCFKKTEAIHTEHTKIFTLTATKSKLIMPFIINSNIETKETDWKNWTIFLLLQILMKLQWLDTQWKWLFWQLRGLLFSH